MTTLITGGAGFIGSQLALRLVRDGERVLIIDNFDDYYSPTLKRANIDAVLALGGACQVIEGDIRDPGTLQAIFRNNDIRKIAHLAALANVRYSIDRGPIYSDVNVTATVSLLDLARQRAVENVIFGSTSSVYGNAAHVPFHEDDPAIAPLAPYPASKRAAELFAYTYFNTFGLNTTVLRFFNVYGPHGRPDMMPIRAIEAILNGTPIQMYGGGHLKRDWTYIDDIVDGVAAALTRPLGFEIINLGYGHPITLLEFIDIYEQLIGKKAVRIDVAAPVSEPAITYCDNTRARTLLGFDPRTPISEGLARTWAWYKGMRGST